MLAELWGLTRFVGVIQLNYPWDVRKALRAYPRWHKRDSIYKGLFCFYILISGLGLVVYKVASHGCHLGERVRFSSSPQPELPFGSFWFHKKSRPVECGATKDVCSYEQVRFFQGADNVS